MNKIMSNNQIELIILAVRDGAAFAREFQWSASVGAY
jgi:hypothetical protein